jgi:hypothetical protein
VAELVAHAIEHRLPQIGLERADVPRLEAPHGLQRLEQGVLDKIVGVRQVTRGPR